LIHPNIDSINFEMKPFIFHFSQSAKMAVGFVRRTEEVDGPGSRRLPKWQLASFGAEAWVRSVRRIRRACRTSFNCQNGRWVRSAHRLAIVQRGGMGSFAPGCKLDGERIRLRTLTIGKS
jgi:hypothetical protein